MSEKTHRPLDRDEPEDDEAPLRPPRLPKIVDKVGNIPSLHPTMPIEKWRGVVDLAIDDLRAEQKRLAGHIDRKSAETVDAVKNHLAVAMPAIVTTAVEPLKTEQVEQAKALKAQDGVLETIRKNTELAAAEKKAREQLQAEADVREERAAALRAANANAELLGAQAKKTNAEAEHITHDENPIVRQQREYRLKVIGVVLVAVTTLAGVADHFLGRESKPLELPRPETEEASPHH